ncbi:aluminum-activated malate transporter 8-like [Vigna umbellata]|uniref:aluminum-activated malate transporter 8-like n=1 Tax=Vigna umbellata TaxID=87088 RepID=UPI001F5F154F|nr:aluminum-activated malate transporter 8-like [Vigna umbellata]
MENPGCTCTWRTLYEKPQTMLVNFKNMVVKLGKDDPRRITHSLKFGFALVLITIFQYFRPSFYVLGDNIMWAVITVVFVLEFSVGATLGKGLNRVLATAFAGGLAVALREIASFFGDKGKVVMITVSVFFVAGTVTFLRFSPRLKAKYDYGMIIFNLTFCIVALSETTENELLEVAQERLLTIIIGTCIAITVCICICPVWIGQDLHNQIASNIVKIADFLEGFRDEYFNNLGKTAEAEDDKSFLHRYESILSSKTNEETMAVLARWEPRHGRFRFRHPWKQYLKLGNQIRLCAYKIKALSVFLLRSDQTPYEIRSRIEEPCANIIMESGKALKESSLMLKQFAKSGMANPHVANAKNASESLKSVLRTNPWEGADHLQIIPAATVASLLIDIVFCVEKICEAVEELANLANFEPSEILHRGTVQPIPDTDGAVHVITIAE